MEIESLIGALDESRFAQLVQLGKRITDYVAASHVDSLVHPDRLTFHNWERSTAAASVPRCPTAKHIAFPNQQDAEPCAEVCTKPLRNGIPSVVPGMHSRNSNVSRRDSRRGV